jgi:hypothetical protein
MIFFISKRNQELLWRVINKNVIIKNMDINFKTDWFKQTISYYYEKHKNDELTKEDIIKINNDFIEHIKKDLKFMNELREKQEEEYKKQIEEEERKKNEAQEKKRNENYLLMSTNDMDRKKDELNEELIRKQDEFNELLNTKAPKEIDFKEKDQEEGTIKNMDELLKARQDARDNIDKETHIMYDKYVKANNLLDENKDKEEVGEIEVIEPL